MKPLLEINSEMYTRRLAKQVNEAIGVRGAFHDGRLIYKAIAWCCVEVPLCIQILHSGGSSGVLPAQYDKFVDGHGLQILASRGPR